MPLPSNRAAMVHGRSIAARLLYDGVSVLCPRAHPPHVTTVSVVNCDGNGSFRRNLCDVSLGLL
jgi:hypothetical protein